MVAAKHHITKFLPHRGNIYRGSETLWGGTHRAWLRTLVMNDADDQQLLEFKLMRLSTREAELRELDERIVERAQRDDTCMAVRDLEAFRGVRTLTAVNVLAEFGDPRRLANKAAVAAYVGLVPNEHSSGNKVRRGDITRAGSRHLRRLLVESSQHYRSELRHAGSDDELAVSRRRRPAC